MNKNSIFALIVICVSLIGSTVSPIFPNWDLFSGRQTTSVEIIMWQSDALNPMLLSDRKAALNSTDKKILQLAKDWRDLEQKNKKPPSPVFLKLLKERCPNCQKFEIANILLPAEEYLFLSAKQKIAHLSIIGSFHDSD